MAPVEKFQTKTNLASEVNRRQMFFSEKDLSGFFRLAETNQGRTLSFTPSDVYQLRNRSDALERLTKFLVKFEIEKGLLSVGDRHQLHRDFLDLVQYYREENYEPQAIQLAQELANHAFKTPEGKCA